MNKTSVKLRAKRLIRKELVPAAGQLLSVRRGSARVVGRSSATSSPEASKEALDELRFTLAVLQSEFAQFRAQANRDLQPSDCPPVGKRRVWDFPKRTLRNTHLHLFGANVFLEPIADLVITAQGEAGSEFEMTGPDPQLLLQVAQGRDLPQGRYILKFRKLTGASQLVDPTLYPDSGNDFNELKAQRLRFSTSRSNMASTQFILPAGAKRLRLDPSTTKGQFVAGSMKLRRVAASEYYLRMAVYLFRQRVRTFGDFKRTVRIAATTLREGGFKAIAFRLRSAHAIVGEQIYTPTYRSWIDKYDKLDEAALDGVRERIAKLAEKPLISVVMPVYNTPEHLLRDAIDSVCNQIYENWELCIADDHSPLQHVKEILNEYAAKDARIKVVLRAANGHISEATNSAFKLASGAWIALMDHDDLLRPHALAEVACEIASYPDAELIYSDEDKLDDIGNRYDPYFKPDYSRELFRSQNYLNHLSVHRSENIRAVGGWRKGFEGSQDYDLNLRIVERIDAKNIRHIPKVLYHWRAVSGSTAVAGSEKSYAHKAGLRALEEHLRRLKLPAKATSAPNTPFYRVQFEVPNPQPLVSLIIPTRDKLQLLRGCITSIREKTTYQNYEVIVVDNGSCEVETLAYLDGLEKEPRARVLRYDKPFNYSAINNYAVGHAKGSILGLINNDIEVISPDWLTEMVSWAAQPDIGCVGAKLYYNNNTIQHAGVILGIGGVAGHSHKYFPRDHHGYFSRLKVLQNLSAVTAACLVVRASVFKEVGGLNEQHLTVAFNDVDFCLKVRDAGYQNVWTPYAELYHLESVSRGVEDNLEKLARFDKESQYMRTSWDLGNDPFYSVNLTRDREDFSIA